MDILNAIEAAKADGQLLESAAMNLSDWVEGEFLPEWGRDSIAELVQSEAWDELNDRFYQFLAFGTGGMRNRTIGQVVTSAERGSAGKDETPAHPAIGTAVLNDFNIVRATVGLFRYCRRHLEKGARYPEVPRLVIAHDVRHFSRHFCELTASTWNQLGGEAMIFDGPRSTPQLSFTVREVGATAGIVITASHNPSHDNGYKVYFEDGAQVVYPHAEGIIHEVYQVKMEETPAFLDIDLDGVVVLNEKADAAYLKVLEENLLEEDIFEKAKPSIVFSAIHGTGGITGPKVLQRYGLEISPVAEQMKQDPDFSTVKSPNPENSEALSMAIRQADAEQAEIVMATDPDSDRMGVAVRNAEGEMVLLSGNMVGSLLAAYRIEKLKDLGILPENGSDHAALIKTFVTTPLQESIAKKHGLKVINTLTGFKWIGEKLLAYENELKAEVLGQTGIAMDYDATPLATRRKLLLDHSTYYVFGGEESYGYLASDRVRDKDANAAVLMFAEMAAGLKATGKTIPEYLDEVYLRYGYYLEETINIYYEGASGASKIASILKAYRGDPPEKIGDFKVTEFRDFGTQEIFDADEKQIPAQDFYFLQLDNGYSFAVRGSGTEPKIKFYIFAKEDVTQPGDLPLAKEQARSTIEELKKSIETDARERAER